MKKLSQSILWIAFIAQLVFLPGCNGEKAENEGDAHRETGPENSQPASITLTAAAMTSAEIKTASTVKMVFRQRITAPGELDFNARRLIHITALTPGRIERILTVAGDRVRAGQLLAEIYSPEYMSTQAEFLQAAERADRFSGDPHEAATVRAFLESARERLILLGATNTELAELQRTRVPQPLLPVRASLAGTIIESSSIPGDHVELGSNLFRLADLSILWAGLHIQEKDLAAVKTGSAVEFRTQAFPGEIFQGRLLLVGDVLDPQTRTVIGRVEVPNPAGKLKAGMYIEAFMPDAEERTVLAVPEAAVQDNEGQQIVFVQTEKGIFAKREIKTGGHFTGWVEILGGLTEGEKVVTFGSFLLKSELNKSSLEE
jgi:RND family efflux transporter MFP subunit